MLDLWQCTVAAVRFCRDANRNGSLDLGDELIATDSNHNGFVDDGDTLEARAAPDGLGNRAARVRITRGWSTGPLKIFALASDASGENGDVREFWLHV